MDNDNLHKIEEELENIKNEGCGRRNISGYKCIGRGIRCEKCKEKINNMEIEVNARKQERNVAMKKAIEWSKNLNPIEIPEHDLNVLLNMIVGDFNF